MSAFTVFSSDCILLNNLIDGLGRGNGVGPNLMSSADGQSLLAPEEAGAGRGRKAGVVVVRGEGG